MRALLVSTLLILCPVPQDGKAPAPSEKQGEPSKPEVPPPPPEAVVVKAVAEAARANATLDRELRRSGDGLFDHYVRVAAGSAGGDAKAFFVGLAIALDPDGSLEKHPLMGHHFRGRETAEAAAARRKRLGAPTLHGRGDLARHFAVSGALAMLLDARFAEQAGYLKEEMDAREGGSGFSLKDSLANLSGIRLASWLREEATKRRLKSLAETFSGARFMPDPKDQPEGMTLDELLEHCEETDGSLPATKKALKASVEALPAYAKKRREPDPKKGAPGKE
ncbi:MAG: hypothetical protein ACYTG4_06085 [Planctomycetota bacterium]